MEEEEEDNDDNDEEEKRKENFQKRRSWKKRYIYLKMIPPLANIKPGCKLGRNRSKIMEGTFEGICQTDGSGNNDFANANTGEIAAPVWIICKITCK